MKSLKVSKWQDTYLNRPTLPPIFLYFKQCLKQTLQNCTQVTLVFIPDKFEYLLTSQNSWQVWCRAFDNIMCTSRLVQPQNYLNWPRQKSHSLTILSVASSDQWSVSFILFYIFKPKQCSPACFERLLVLVFSREEARLHLWQQELPQRVFGPGPGGYCWTSPWCSSQRRPLGHLTGKVLSRSIITLLEQLLNKQAMMLSTEHCLHYNNCPPATLADLRSTFHFFLLSNF